uniref:dolichol kinase n=1 Tax=Phlebotomus papatasi TaxID=29031 RepID=A0A1B0DI48_PHLPP
MTTDEIESVHVEENMTSEAESEGRFISRKNLDFHCKSRNIHRRPNAGDGLWLCTLIPLCLLINCWTHPKSSSLLYKVCSFISFGLFLQSVDILVKLSCRKVNIFINALTKVIPGITSSLLIWYLLNIKIILSFACGIPSSLFFNFIYLYILKRFSQSFTLGEATIVTQGLTIFLFGASVKFASCLHEPPMSKMAEMSAILSVSLLGVLLLIFLVHSISFCRKPIIFSLLLILWILLSGFTPVTDPFPAILVGMFIFLDVGRVSVILIYAGIAGVTGAFVAWKISKKSSTSVSLRKVFHIVIVIVYIIGILFQCTMLFLASGFVLALFIIF